MEIERLREILATQESARTELQSAVGLLYESGHRLEQLVSMALAEVGVAIGKPVDREEYTAEWKGVIAAVEVKGWAKSATEDDFRALMSYLAQHDLEGKTESRGILAVCGWRNRPRQSRPATFPDNVSKAASRGGRVALVGTEDLYEAVLAKRRGEPGAVEGFVDRLFANAGVVTF